MEYNTSTTPIRPLWTVEDVAKYLRKSKDWVYHHVGGGYEPQLPCLKIGGALRFKQADIEAFADRQVHGVADNQDRGR